MNDLVQNQSQNDNEQRILVIVSYVFLIFFPLVSIILSYVKRKDSENTIYYSHHQYIIKTFWLGLLSILFGILSSIGSAAIMANGFFSILAGLFFFLAVGISIWYLVRVILGLVKAASKQPIGVKN